MDNDKTKELIARSMESIRRSHALLGELEKSNLRHEELSNAFRMEMQVLQAELREIARLDQSKIIH